VPHISYLFTTVYLQTAFIFIQDSSSKLTDCQLRKDSNSIFQLIRAIISSLFELISLLFMMPSVFTRLWVAHFCSWMGLMCVILYYTEFFGEIMYQGDPNAEKGSIDRQNYEEGLRMGSLGLFTQNIIAMFSSFYIDALILKFGKRNVFLLSTGLFAISTGIIFASRNVVLVILATGTTGLLLTTIQVLPYSLISQYQKDATVSIKYHVFSSKNIS